MERILQIYERAYSPQLPVVAFDESSKQLVQDVIESLPARPRSPKKYDSEYQRNGVGNLFLFFEPLAGRRHIIVTERRTAVDFAHAMKYLVDNLYPDCPQICVVLDNLNIHCRASLYKAFPPKEAMRISNRLIFEYTPKHGSWLNVAEIEFSALSRQCLNRRIPDQETLVREIRSWVKWRNKHKAKCNWQFSVDDARIKLRSLYPELN